MSESVWKMFTSGELFLISGPCVIESREHAIKIGKAVAEAAQAVGLPAVFKASFDKANRTSVDSFRGPGLEEGLRVLAEVKRETGLPILTDVHQPDQVAQVAEVCDVVQIPAFLCRQTDLLVAAGNSGRVVNIKKGQFLAPWDMKYAAEKVASSGNEKILLTERGSSFGYQNLVVDFRALAIMRDLGYPTVLDVTHSLQLPGAQGGASGGQPEFIELLARAGVAAGVSGVFFEVHDNPESAKSDGANALQLELLAPLLSRLVQLYRLTSSWNSEGAKDPSP